MGRNPRHDKILNLLQNLRQISVSDLTERLGVSQVTIRKDLTILEEKGLILRNHGGAMLAQATNQISTVSTRKGLFFDKKDRITSKAIELIQEGDSVCIDASSTNLLLAEKIKTLPIRVITNSLEIMKTLSSSRDITLTAIGGNFRQEASSFIGPIAEDTINQLQFDIAFIGATGISVDGDFLTHNTIEGNVKKAMLKAAKRKVILADSSKLNARSFSKFANADLIDVLITDSKFSETDLFRKMGIEVLMV
ncbi:DeoR/GlpR family DNA-binding transcription regulator [Oceanispirochaeta sp.]|jgi:DeoR/GlpR family transcriptional regulator of sugar metabolism|uniref:DeoR/GlpR family DNA-binding transcription regulator n=1 Tax=Oceanispirochaeta sp. TaxID=2035350 RepID=UPI00260DDE4F|nr:DeoR/GlpR family DNA-binding transcription regulator [Oceanispirochaeta sp.]MDA3956611.1 DeoR/GlpR family DNA-binding transcription regulator [Oceanispirochaeta sp.]